MRRIAYSIDAGEEYCEKCEHKKAVGLCIDTCRLFRIKLKIEGLEDDCTEENEDQPLRTFRCEECLQRDLGSI